MLALFTGKSEVIVCEVINGQPILAGYFDGDGRDEDDYDFALVEGPVKVECMGLSCRSERNLS